MHSSHSPDTELLYWPEPRIRAYQLDRLRETVARAARSPHYGRRLAGERLESLADLARLPFTSKADIRDSYPDGLLAVAPEELVHYGETFGTSGRPTSSWLTRADLRNYSAGIRQTPIALRPGDRVMVRCPYAFGVVGAAITQAANDARACVIPACFQSAFSPYPRVVDALGNLGVTVLTCLPTEAFHLAEAARLRGRDPARDFPHLRAIGVAGELLTAARRARLAEVWQRPVYNFYGCNEGGAIASDCPAGRLHLSWDHCLLEVLAEGSERPAAPGELGVAVLTTLTREAQPLLRFVLGDHVRLRDGSTCSCGRTAPVLELYGRDSHCFDFGSRRYFVRDLEDRLLVAPVSAVANLWLVEVRPDEVRFRVEAERPDATLYRRLEDQIRVELDLPLRIDAVEPGALLSRERLTRATQFGKPQVVGHVESATAPSLTLDDLSQDL